MDTRLDGNQETIEKNTVPSSERKRAGSPKEDRSPKRRGTADAGDDNRQFPTDSVEEQGHEDKAETYKKKKKDFIAKSDIVLDDEFEDIIQRGWLYVDSNGERQGPYTTKEMKEWYVAGFFTDQLLVKRVIDPDFLPIFEQDEFKRLEQKTVTQLSYTQYNTQFAPPSGATPVATFEPHAENAFEPMNPANYSQKASFTTLGGRFSSADHSSYWDRKGIPSDKAGRMLSHYLDIDAYQEQMRMASEQPQKRKKIGKNTIKLFKKRKEEKKRKRALML